jgi:hypothetical protein
MAWLAEALARQIAVDQIEAGRAGGVRYTHLRNPSNQKSEAHSPK